MRRELPGALRGRHRTRVLLEVVEPGEVVQRRHHGRRGGQQLFELGDGGRILPGLTQRVGVGAAHLQVVRMFRHPRFEGGGRVTEFAFVAHARQRQRGGSRWSLGPQLLERRADSAYWPDARLDSASNASARGPSVVSPAWPARSQRFGRIARAQLELRERGPGLRRIGRESPAPCAARERAMKGCPMPGARSRRSTGSRRRRPFSVPCAAALRWPP
jgi:hypothetical protein